MHDLHTIAGALHAMQVLGSAFLAILFLQSGIDKIVDRRGNLEWLKGHFAKSPLAGFVPLMVTMITIMELAAALQHSCPVSAAETRGRFPLQPQ